MYKYPSSPPFLLLSLLYISSSLSYSLLPSLLYTLQQSTSPSVKMSSPTASSDLFLQPSTVDGTESVLDVLLCSSPPSSSDLAEPTSSSSESIPVTRRPRTCWVFNHIPDEDPEAKYYNNSGKEEWRCKYCSKTYAKNGGNTCIKRHLFEKHAKTEKSSRENVSAKRQRSIEHALQLAETQSFKRRKLNTTSGDGHSLDGSHLEVLYIKFLTACHLPLRLVECPEFRDLLNYINNDIDTWLPTSHTTITHWVLRQFNSMKEQMKSRLHSARTDIHISCDLWTSPNCLPILGFVGHYISEDGRLESPTLALVEVEEEHSGENLARYLQEFVEDWVIGSKLGYIQMDNAKNNDTMMREFEDRKYRNTLLPNSTNFYSGIRCLGYQLQCKAPPDPMYRPHYQPVRTIILVCRSS